MATALFVLVFVVCIHVCDLLERGKVSYLDGDEMGEMK